MEDGDMTIRILVLKEKHDTTFLNASTNAKLHKAALSVVKARLHPDWGYYYDPVLPEPINLTLEDINKLPDGRGKAALVKQFNAHLKEMEEYRNDQYTYDRAVRAAAQNDGAEAWLILTARSDYEYEGVYLSEVQDEYE